MADRAIAAGDIRFQIVEQHDFLDFRSGTNKRLVGGVLTVVSADADSAVLYPAADIPLTNLFTAGSGYDTGLDVNQPILGFSEDLHIAAGAVAPAASAPSLPTRFVSIGAAAASKLLVVYGPNSAATGPRLQYSAATISAANADSSINDSATAFPAFVVGEPILISGFTGTAANNQVGVVVSRTTAKIVVTTAVAFTNDAAGETVTVTSLWPKSSGAARVADNEDLSAANFLGADTVMTCRLWLIGNRRPGLVGNST